MPRKAVKADRLRDQVDVFDGRSKARLSAPFRDSSADPDGRHLLPSGSGVEHRLRVSDEETIMPQSGTTVPPQPSDGDSHRTAPKGSGERDTNVHPWRAYRRPVYPAVQLPRLRRGARGSEAAHHGDAMARTELVEDGTQGVQLALMQELADYWATDYDWRRCEARLNALPKFITEIDGLDIHFIHVRSKHENALPLIVTHGWPGSPIEQLKIIDPLTNPTAHGGSASDAFDVVIPSGAGYGFSGKPTTPGWDPARMARAWTVLMKRLGYSRFSHRAAIGVRSSRTPWLNRLLRS